MISAGTLSSGRCWTVGEVVVVLAWPGVECLVEMTLQNLHDAVCVGVVMDGRSFARHPYEYQLLEHVSICQAYNEWVQAKLNLPSVWCLPGCSFHCSCR